MLSLKDLFSYNLDYHYGDKLEVRFENDSTKYEIECEDIFKMSNYPVAFFSGYKVRLLFSMKDSDKEYFKEVKND